MTALVHQPRLWEVDGIVEGDPHWSSVAALLHFDGADGSTDIVDEKGAIWTPQGAAKLTTEQARFGPSSLDLTGAAGTRVFTPESQFLNPGAGDDWTFEAFVYPRALPSGGGGLTTVMSTRNGATTGWVVYLTSAGFVRFIGYSSGSAATDITASGGAASLNQWSHIAASKIGGTWRIFANGILVGNTTNAAGAGGNATCHIGWDGTSMGGRHFNGCIDEIRITLGVGRYASNFAPPTEPFPNGP